MSSDAQPRPPSASSPSHSSTRFPGSPHRQTSFNQNEVRALPFLPGRTSPSISYPASPTLPTQSRTRSPVPVVVAASTPPDQSSLNGVFPSQSRSLSGAASSRDLPSSLTGFSLPSQGPLENDHSSNAHTHPPRTHAMSGVATANTTTLAALTTDHSIGPAGVAEGATANVNCGGCKKPIGQGHGVESNGVVVAFGQSLWHVNCFRCAKCNNLVTADTNLLLLSDGSPVCSNCSYQCFVCKLPITEEAIMTGDESYHAACFTCRSCNKRIEELVFAKTSQGIYCMACHNERVAKSRRHAEAKKVKAKRDRDKEAMRGKEYPKSGLSSLASSGDGATERNDDRGSRTSSMRSSASTVVRGPARTGSPSAPPNRASPSIVADGGLSTTPESTEPSGIQTRPGLQERGESLSYSRDAEVFDHYTGRDQRTPSPSFRSRTDSEGSGHRQPLPMIDSYGDPNPVRRGSGEDIGSAAPPTRVIGLGVGNLSGLGVPTSRVDKRRSMNPGLTYSYEHDKQDRGSAPPASTSLPTSDAFQAGRLSPLPPSPLRASFTDPIADHSLERHGSPTPKRSGQSLYPAAQPRAHSKSDVPLGAPPRSTSLAEFAAEPRGHDKKDIPADRDSPGLQSSEPRPEFSSSEDGSSADHAPQLLVPALPSLNFSLSDPDFALLLKDDGQSRSMTTPEAAQVSPSKPGIRTRTQTLGSHIGPLRTPGRGNASSLPNSPSTTTSGRSDMSPPIVGPAEGGEVHLTALAPRQPLPPRTTSAETSSTAESADMHELQERPVSAATEIAKLQVEDVAPAPRSPSSIVAVLQAFLASAVSGGSNEVEMDVGLLQKALDELIHLNDSVSILKGKYSGAKRTSQHYATGLSVASEEYDKEVSARLEAEAEVTRLRAQLHSQTARLSIATSDERRRESLRRRSDDLALNLSGLEKDLSKLQAERDMTLAEVQELAATRQDDHLSTAEAGEQGVKLARSFTKRLNGIKEKYKEELEPLSEARETLKREIGELKLTRSVYLEESAALSAKNEELSDLNLRLSRQAEALQESLIRARPPTAYGHLRGHKHNLSGSPSMSSLTTASTSSLGMSLQEVSEDPLRMGRPGRSDAQETIPAAKGRFKWYKSSKGPETVIAATAISKPLGVPTDRLRHRPSHDNLVREHVFQQHTILRFSKCEHCGEKMWGLQELRCAVCGVFCHTKCADRLGQCNGPNSTMMQPPDVPGEPAPGSSMFGRDLTEQAILDGSLVPAIVKKCIDAVEAQAMDYEGVYRKTGGSSLSKHIQHLFDRGDYDSFDLRDTDKFNDVNSITSVLKSFFRNLPNPLLTYELHEQFVEAAGLKDSTAKYDTLRSLIKELPPPHYDTLRYLMVHLNRVKLHSSSNLMNARNLGVVFGPTLMRSPDPAREFGDMAGKAMSIEWLVENAPAVLLERK